MPTFKEFRERHESTGYFDDWKLDDSVEMSDAWQSLTFRQMLSLATFEGVLTDQELRMLSVVAARQVQHLLRCDETRYAIDVAEKFANGEATIEELTAAHNASNVDPWQNLAAASAASAASDPSSGLVWSALNAVMASRDAARSDVIAEKKDSVGLPKPGLVVVTARKKNVEALEKLLVEWLRNNTSPTFE